MINADMGFPEHKDCFDAADVTAVAVVVLELDQDQMVFYSCIAVVAVAVVGNTVTFEIELIVGMGIEAALVFVADTDHLGHPEDLGRKSTVVAVVEVCCTADLDLELDVVVILVATVGLGIAVVAYVVVVFVASAAVVLAVSSYLEIVPHRSLVASFDQNVAVAAAMEAVVGAAIFVFVVGFHNFYFGPEFGMAVGSV
ncbi:hypothetical protein WICPIJ_003387 [Wickerhamomyces pijperi]|uniref:Uncharacterized protein n=1 Tax=Wickerhamomyces pijperi TaxID=599730 RepID=A0A9P8TNX6_WICPI|nr:hypothetical protein WICPIJ_003387 [Wickerhamomyces pijperi]